MVFSRVGKRLALDRHSEAPHKREVRLRLMSRLILLREHHLLRFSVFCLPLLDPALQRSQLALAGRPLPAKNRTQMIEHRFCFHRRRIEPSSGSAYHLRLTPTRTDPSRSSPMTSSGMTLCSVAFPTSGTCELSFATSPLWPPPSLASSRSSSTLANLRTCLILGPCPHGQDQP